MLSSLAIYLRYHEAAGQAGSDLFRRVVRSHRGQPYAPELQRLSGEIKADLQTLRALMRRFRVAPDLGLSLALRAGERVGRLKPNGTLLRRSPLTDLIEIEALLDAVRAKMAGWLALAAAGDPLVTPEFEALLARAEEQAAILTGIHHQVAARVLELP